MDVLGNMLPVVLIMPSSDSFDNFLVTCGGYFCSQLFVFLIEKWLLGGEKYIFNPPGLCIFFFLKPSFMHKRLSEGFLYQKLEINTCARNESRMASVEQQQRGKSLVQIPRPKCVAST